MRKQRLREVNITAQRHTASEWLNQVFDYIWPDFKAHFF